MFYSANSIRSIGEAIEYIQDARDYQQFQSAVA